MSDTPDKLQDYDVYVDASWTIRIPAYSHEDAFEIVEDNFAQLLASGKLTFDSITYLYAKPTEEEED